METIALVVAIIVSICTLVNGVSKKEKYNVHY